MSANHPDVEESSTPVGLFEVIREPSPPDMPTRVRIEMPEEVDHRRGPGTKPTPNEGSAPSYWWGNAEAVVLRLAQREEGVTADDLHEAYPEEPSASGAAIGSLFRHLRQRGLIRLDGYQPSRRPQNRGRVVGVWRSA